MSRMDPRTLIPGWPALRGSRWSDQLAESYLGAGLWDRRGFDGLLAAHAEKAPQKMACTDGEEELSFQQLRERSRAVASWLVDRGLRRGEVVLVHMGSTVDHLTVVHAVMAASGVVYELPRDATRELTASAAVRTGARFLISDRVRKAELENVLEDGLVIAADPAEREVADAGLDQLEAGEASDLSPQDPNDVAVLIGTSGTTGTPKLVMRSPNSWVGMVAGMVERTGTTADDVLQVIAPLYGGVGFANAVTIPLVTGCSLVLAPTLETGALLSSVERYGVTKISTLPTLAARMMHSPELTDAVASTVDVVQTGGAFIQPNIASELEERFSCRLAIVYGSADVGTVTMTSAVEDPPEKRWHTVGKPLAGAEIRIAGDDGDAVSVGEVGEVVMRGPSLSLGYFGDPDATAAVFDADGWGRFGDLGQLDADGYLRIVGRLKDIINRGGRKISANEVESVVCGLPGVVDAAAVAYPDPDLGERCAVFVVTDEGMELTLEALREELAERKIPIYMWPEKVENIGELPVSPAGKVLKDRLRKQLSETTQ